MELVSIAVKDVAGFKQSLKENILAGKTDVLEFYRTSKLFREAFEELGKDPEIMDYAFSEIDKWGKQKPTVQGSVIGAGSRSNYDYTSCEDPVWSELKEKLSARERLLKALPSEGMVCPETGVFIKPPTVTVSKYITVKA